MEKIRKYVENFKKTRKAEYLLQCEGRRFIFSCRRSEKGFFLCPCFLFRVWLCQRLPGRNGRDEERRCSMNAGKVFESLIHLAASKGIMVKFAPLQVSYARIKGDRIALSNKLETIDDFNYNLAHELAHAFLHYDKGNILPGEVDNELSKQYEEQADRAAKMLVEALSVAQKGGAV